MTAVAEKPDVTHRVGKIEFTVVADDSAPEPDERARRVEAIAAWLMAEWEREQRRRLAERN